MTWNPIGNVASLMGSEERYADGKLKAEIRCEWHSTPVRDLGACLTSCGDSMECSEGAVQGLGPIVVQKLEASVIESQLHWRARHSLDWAVAWVRQATKIIRGI